MAPRRGTARKSDPPKLKRKASQIARQSPDELKTSTSSPKHRGPKAKKPKTEELSDVDLPKIKVEDDEQDDEIDREDEGQNDILQCPLVDAALEHIGEPYLTKLNELYGPRPTKHEKALLDEHYQFAGLHPSFIGLQGLQVAQQYYHKAQGLENLTYEENVAAMKAEVEEAAHIICDLRHGPISPPSPEKKGSDTDRHLRDHLARATASQVSSYYKQRFKLRLQPILARSTRFLSHYYENELAECIYADEANHSTAEEELDRLGRVYAGEFKLHGLDRVGYRDYEAVSFSADALSEEVEYKEPDVVLASTFESGWKTSRVMGKPAAPDAANSENE